MQSIIFDVAFLRVMDLSSLYSSFVSLITYQGSSLLLIRKDKSNGVGQHHKIMRKQQNGGNALLYRAF